MDKTAITALLASLALSAGAHGAGPDIGVETVRHRIYEDLLPVRREPGSREVQEIHKKAHDYAAGLREDGTWKDIDYRDRTASSWKAIRHLYRLRQMAISYQIPGYDPKLKGKILKALDHWLTKDYRNPNHWWNVIGVPRQLGDTLVLMEKELSAEQIKKGVEILGRGYRNGRWDYHGDATGQNLVWLCSIHVVRGCLEEKPEEIARPLERIAREIRITSREGIQADMTFHQHGPCLYSGGYGLGFAVDCARLAYYANGTRFAIPRENLDILSSYILEGQQWMVWAGTFDYGALGREIVRRGIKHKWRPLARACDYMAKIAGEREPDFQGFAKRLRAGKPEGGPVGNRYFRRSAFMVHRRKDYYASVRMLGDGLLTTDDAHNGEGLLSHHLSDGVTYVLRSGKEYEDIFPVWNWRRVPGITAEQSTASYDVNTVGAMGLRAFVGGASDGTYGAAAMDFATPTRGKDFPAQRLKARKTWFFFDREFVCLGAAITCSGGNRVVTSVAQRLLKGNVLSSSEAEAREGHTVLKAPGWLHHDGIGYLFLEDRDVHISAGAQKGSWRRINTADSAEEVSRDVFDVWLDHGVKPIGASYHYVVAPGVAARDMKAYSWNHGVEFLRNTADIQAVRHRRLKMLQAVFYKPGTLTQPRAPSITVDRPCIIILHTGEGKRRISVAQPGSGRKPEPLTVTVGDERIVIELPGGRGAGRTVTKNLKDRE